MRGTWRPDIWRRKCWAGVDEFAGDDAVFEDAAFVVDVLEEEVEGGDALGETALDLGPLGAGDDAREEVVGEDFLGAFFAAVDGEGDALVEEAEVGGLFSALDFVLREGGEVLEEGTVVLAQFILRGEHLVERMIQLVVPGRRRLGGTRRCGRGVVHGTFSIGQRSAEAIVGGHSGAGLT